MGRFRWDDGRLVAGVSGPERDLLRALPILVRGAPADDGAPGWARLRSVGHLGDPGAAAGFAELTAGLLREARAEDLDRFEATLGADRLEPADAEAWLRVIGEARLAVAARLGIEQDGWDEDPAAGSAFEVGVLHVLGHLQEALVAALAERL